MVDKFTNDSNSICIIHSFVKEVTVKLNNIRMILRFK